eukprot:1160803-Pelagomonas_calceolata.AAC.11
MKVRNQGFNKRRHARVLMPVAHEKYTFDRTMKQARQWHICMLACTQGKMETVLRISAKRDAEHLNEGSSGDYGHQGNGGQHRGHRQGGDGKGGPQRLDINPGEGKANREASLETTHEGDVDRIVTHDNAVFVLSKPRCGNCCSVWVLSSYMELLWGGSLTRGAMPVLLSLVLKPSSLFCCALSTQFIIADAWLAP